MPFNDIELQKIKKIVGGFCQERIPDHQRCQIKVFYEVHGFDVIIIESRPCSVSGQLWVQNPIAKLLYDSDSYRWQLYSMRVPGKWEKYLELKPTNYLEALIEEIEKDPYCVFWG